MRIELSWKRRSRTSAGQRLTTISANPSWEVHLDSAGVQATDLLSWYRAFHPGVDDAIVVKQYFTGAMTLRGWPLQIKNAAFSSEGGEARVPGISAPLRIGAIEGGRQRDMLTIEPVRISYGALTARAEATTLAAASGATAGRALNEGRGSVNVGFAHDFGSHVGHISIDGHVERIEDALRVAEAFGRPLNHGWELSGSAGAASAHGSGTERRRDVGTVESMFRTRNYRSRG